MKSDRDDLGPIRYPASEAAEAISDARTKELRALLKHVTKDQHDSED